MPIYSEKKNELKAVVCCSCDRRFMKLHGRFRTERSHNLFTGIIRLAWISCNKLNTGNIDVSYGHLFFSLRKQAYSNILNILPPKKMKIFW